MKLTLFYDRILHRVILLYKCYDWWEKNGRKKKVASRLREDAIQKAMELIIKLIKEEKKERKKERKIKANT